MNPNKIKRTIAGLMACIMLLGNLPAMAFDAAAGNLPYGTYAVPISVKQSEGSSSIVSRSAAQYMSPASLSVAEDGSATLVIDVARYNSGSTTYYYPKSIQYKTAGSESWINAVTLSSEYFEVKSGFQSKSDTRPSQIQLNLTSADVSGLEIKYGEYKISHSSSNSLNTTVEGYLAIDISDIQQAQAERPTISAAGVIDGLISTSSQITLASGTTGASIYYSVNGGEYMLYAGPFTVQEDATISAYAAASGYDKSDVASATYKIMGDYGVPVAFKKASSPTDDSMAASALASNGFLKVLEDGTIQLIVKFQEATIMFVTASASEIKYYTSAGVDENYAVPCEILTTSGGNPEWVVMEAHHPELGGVYAGVYLDVMSMGWQDAFIDIDTTNVEGWPFINDNSDNDSDDNDVVDPQPDGGDGDNTVDPQPDGGDGDNTVDPQPDGGDGDNAVDPQPDDNQTPDVTIGFGSGETELEAHVYDVPVALKNATNIENASMAAEALGAFGELEVYEDGSAALTVEFSPMSMMGVTASTSYVKFYDSNDLTGNIYDAEVLAQDEEGNPTSVKIAIPNNSWDGIYVRLGLMDSYQNAYIAIDYANAELSTGDGDGDNTVDPQPDGGDGDNNDVVNPQPDGGNGENNENNDDIVPEPDGGDGDNTVDPQPDGGDGDNTVDPQPDGGDGDNTVDPQPDGGDGDNTVDPQPDGGDGDDNDVVNPQPDGGNGENNENNDDIVPEPDGENGENGAIIGFGAYNIELDTAIFEVSVALKNATNIENDSMAASALAALGQLEVYEDGSASITVEFGPMTFMGVTANASYVKFYDSNNLTGNLYDAEVLAQDEEGNPTSVKIAIPNNRWDGIYVQLGLMGNYQNAYIAIDYTTAEKIGESEGEDNGFVPEVDEDDDDSAGDNGGSGDGTTDGSTGGSTGGIVPEVELEQGITNGTYSVPVYLKKYEGVKNYGTSSSSSMAADAVVGTAKATVKDEKITYTIQFKGISLLGDYGHMTNLWYYTAEDVADGSLTDPIKASISSYYYDYDNDGEIAKFPETVTFTYEGSTEDDIYIQTYVDVMVDFHYQDAVLVFNWNKAVKDGGSSSGGNSGGVSAPVVTPEEETTGTEGNTVVVPTVTVDKDGKVTATVDADEMSATIQSVVDTAGEDDKKTVVLSIPVEAGTTNVAAVVSHGTVTEMTAHLDSVKLETTLAGLEFHAETLQGIVQHGTGDLTISMAAASVEHHSEAVQLMVGDRPVMSFAITMGEASVTSFDKSLTVTIPYTLGEDENPAKLGIYYLPEDGLPVDMAGAVYANGYMSFETDHFSTFAVVYDENKTVFEDVSSSDWFAGAVAFVLEAGLFAGTSETTFAPQAVMTRAMIMTVLHRLSGDIQFADGDQWYSAGREWAMAMGVSDGTDMEGQLSREQLVTLLYRYVMLDDQYGYEAQDVQMLEQFHDQDQLSHWAAEAMGWALEMGIVNGVGENTLAPQNNATRAEVATILMRFVQTQIAETEDAE